MNNPLDERSEHTDDLAVDRFAAAMKAKLAKKRAQGRSGWDDRKACSNDDLAGMLIEHLSKGDPVDIANFAMMIHQRAEQGIERGTIDNLPYGVTAISFATSKHAEEITGTARAEAWQRGHMAGRDAPDAKAAPSERSGVTDEMVSRFLSWKLPANFNPDGGVTFEPIGNKDHSNPTYRFKREPTGTNLLDADQARTMLEHVLAGVPSEAVLMTLPEMPQAFLTHHIPMGNYAIDWIGYGRKVEAETMRRARAALGAAPKDAPAEPVYQLRAPFSEDWKATPRPQHMRDEEDGFGAWYETTRSAYEQFHLKNKTHKGRVLYLASQPSPTARPDERAEQHPHCRCGRVGRTFLNGRWFCEYCACEPASQPSPQGSGQPSEAAHVGDTRFEGWLSEYARAAAEQSSTRYIKHDLREAYWAGFCERSAQGAGQEALDARSPELSDAAKRGISPMSAWPWATKHPAPNAAVPAYPTAQAGSAGIASCGCTSWTDGLGGSGEIKCAAHRAEEGST